MKNKLLNYNNIIIVLYLVIVLIAFYFHEPWFDEANAWLISRDLGLWGIIKQMSFEGHSCFYFFILKLLIVFGMSYKYGGLLSIFISLIGVIIFVYKSPFNRIINTLFVFSSPFIFFCPIFIRPYSFTMLFMILICCLYKDRYKHPYIFGLLLALLFNTHLLTTPIIGSIVLIEIYDYFKDKEYFKERFIISLLAFIGGLLFALQIVKAFIDRPDVTGSLNIIDNFVSAIYSVTFILEGFYSYSLICFICLFVFIYLVILLKNNKKVLFIIIFNSLFYFLFSLFFYPIYDSKSIYILSYILLGLWLYEEEVGFNRKQIILLNILLIFGIIGSFDHIREDIIDNYSANVEIVNFLEKDKIDDANILTLDYYSDIVLITDDKYKFTSYAGDSLYTYGLYKYENLTNNFKDYILNNDFDYVIVDYPLRYGKDDIKELEEDGYLKEVFISYSIKRNRIVYKVMKGKKCVIIVESF